MGLSIINLDTTSIVDPFEVEKNQMGLRAEKISPFERATAAKVAEVWKKIAREKATLAILETEKTQFEDCADLSDWISDTLSDLEPEESAYVCKDKKGNEQAIIVYTLESEELYVDYLVTNPINIRSAVNDTEKSKVKGAGTCLLKKMEEIALREGKNAVSLCPLGSAVGFYEKNGFLQDGFWGMKKVMNKVTENITPLLVA